MSFIYLIYLLLIIKIIKGKRKCYKEPTTFSHTALGGVPSWMAFWKESNVSSCFLGRKIATTALTHLAKAVDLNLQTYLSNK